MASRRKGDSPRIRSCYARVVVSSSRIPPASIFVSLTALNRWLDGLTITWVMLAVGCVAILVNLGALGLGLFSDDYFHAVAIIGRLTHAPSPNYWWELFGVPSARGPKLETLIETGATPWWTSHGYSTAFFRPLAVASQYFDFVFMHGDQVFMHAHNLAWYVLLTMLVALCHRRFMASPAAAAIATILFTLDEAHSEGLAWIAGRNTLMSACASAGALLLYDRARRRQSTAGVWLAASCTGLGLLSGEGGVAGWGLLLGYALTIDDAAPRQRFTALAPHAVVTLIWALTYRALGYGAHGGGVYIDPFSDALKFLGRLPWRFTVLWLELTTVSGSLYNEIPASSVSVVRASTILMSVVLTIVFVRAAKLDRNIRFWLVASVLSLLPYCSASSGGRLLFTAGIGASALLAWTVSYVLAGKRARTRFEHATYTVLAALCLAVHVAGASFMIPVKFRQLQTIAVQLRALAGTLPVAAADAPSKTVFVLNTASYLASAATLFSREPGQAPGAFFVLGGNQYSVTVTRISTHLIRIAPDGGYLTELTATLVRDPREPFVLDDQFRVGPAGLRIAALTPDGRAAAVDLELENLEDPRFIWTYWDGRPTGYLTVTLPPVGSAIRLPMYPLPAGPEDKLWL